MLVLVLVPFILVRGTKKEKNRARIHILSLIHILYPAGYSTNAPPKDYSINGTMWNRIFGDFNAISLIACAYGNGIIPEIQVLCDAKNSFLHC